MFKVMKRECPVFGDGPYVCEFLCDTATDISTLPTSISEGTGGKTVYDNQKCASGSMAIVADNGAESKQYILNNQDIWCPYSVAAGSSSGGSGGSSITVDSALSETSGSPVANKVITAALNNKADVTHSHSANEVGADASGSAASALKEAKAYTDSEITDLINGAPTTRDTLKEIADAMDENQTVVEALDAAIGTKANKTDIPTKTSELENDSGFLTAHQDLSEYAKTADVTEALTNKANVSHSHSDYALKSKYGDTTIDVGRKAGTTVGSCSVAEGNFTTASGYYSHAEGSSTIASGDESHAEGWQTTASGNESHAEGYLSTASGGNAHAEGFRTTASGDYSHAEGHDSEATGRQSHSEGWDSTASGDNSHAEGNNTTASSYCSHAEGGSTTASGSCSHAEGIHTTATNYASHAQGHYNASMTDGGSSNNTTGTAFVIGNGTQSDRLSNAFSVQFNGTVKAKSTITASTTADYAEFFEWIDGNPNGEDRVGYFVTLDGNKIKIASPDDYILGVVSGEPFVLGNGDCDVWNDMYLRDEFRRTIYEPAPKIKEVDGELVEIEGEFEGTRPKLNPEYDHTQRYISRFDRPEWAPIGMLGVLAVRHDGTAKVNGYVTIADGGIATACEKHTTNSYRVIKSNTDTVVEIIFR